MAVFIKIHVHDVGFEVIKELDYCIKQLFSDSIIDEPFLAHFSSDRSEVSSSLNAVIPTGDCSAKYIIQVTNGTDDDCLMLIQNMLYDEELNIDIERWNFIVVSGSTLRDVILSANRVASFH
ncbi:hypothetical protein [Enterovibrio baiacu]|uniref:hypothetical protein n=1 Tax=Enterovibrio baiacu TaxID=2491023 RepID=UPI0010108883|nr:hypothetical protein [Enterovibrio baiacu]MBE1275107.1 hypothetical protein [Enterovibrio baiacu]